MSEAQQVADTPDEELQQVLDTIASSSASSESQARYDRVCEDGSLIAVTSFQGSEPVVTVVEDHDHLEPGHVPGVPHPPE